MNDIVVSLEMYNHMRAEVGLPPIAPEPIILPDFLESFRVKMLEKYDIEVVEVYRKGSAETDGPDGYSLEWYECTQPECDECYSFIDYDKDDTVVEQRVCGTLSTSNYFEDDAELEEFLNMFNPIVEHTDEQCQHCKEWLNNECACECYCVESGNG